MLSNVAWVAKGGGQRGGVWGYSGVLSNVAWVALRIASLGSSISLSLCS